LTETSSAIDDRRSHARSRLTNGATLPGVDGRSTWVRRLRDVMELHIADLGGEDNLSQAEKSIVRRAATLTVELERLELGFAKADGADPEALDLYSRTAGNLRRLLETVGLQRRSRDVTTDNGDPAIQVEHEHHVVEQADNFIRQLRDLSAKRGAETVFEDVTVNDDSE
jgi:hypothetical protein